MAIALANALDWEPAGWNECSCAAAGWNDCSRCWYDRWGGTSSLYLSENLCGAAPSPPVFLLRSSLRVVEMIWVKCLEVAGSNWRTSVNGFFSPGLSANSSASW